jgi:protein-disulfide isomerase
MWGGITIFMTQETKILGGIGIVTLLLIVGAALFLGGNPQPGETPGVKADQKILVKKDSNVMGSTSAAVTLVEFGDYQCPACGAAHPVVKQLTDAYKGKIRFVFRNFPLPMHQNAIVAAQAAEAAGAQGKYWEMHDMLYENQDAWSDSTEPVSIFATYAKNLGLDVAQFRDMIAKKTSIGKINGDTDDGIKLGVNSTPTFYINGEKQVGGLSYSAFKEKIDAAMK